MKKSLLFNFLLFYSTLAALFISVSGFLSARETGAFVLQLIFLPVTVFLITRSVKTFKSGPPSSDRAFTDKKKVFIRLAISLVIYLCLFAFAYGGITASKTSPGLIFTKDQKEESFENQ